MTTNYETVSSYKSLLSLLTIRKPLEKKYNAKEMEMAIRIKTTKRKRYQDRNVGKINELSIYALFL